MSIVSLRNNIFLVEGANTHAIYDLNKCKLYSINSLTLSFIRRCITANLVQNSLSQKEKNCLKFLLSNSIIEKTDQFKPEIKIENKFWSKNKSINSAWIEVTNLCNLRCIHCYSDQSFNQFGSMDLTSFSYVVNELLSNGVEHIQLIGGEPLILKEKLKEMILLVGNLFKSVGVYSNATLIDSAWAAFFSEQNINVNTTVFSYSPTNHDNVTMCKGSHNRTHQAIQYLNDYDVKYLVTCIMMNGVIIEEKRTNLYDLYNRNDIVRNSGRANLSLLNHELLRKKIIKKNRFTRPLVPKMSSALVSGHNCFSRKIYITHDLKVYPCPMERCILYGSLKENRLYRLIENAPSINKSLIKVCKNCEYRYACMDCRPDRLEDDIYAKPWYCSYDPYRSIWKPVDEFIEEIEQTQLN